MTPSVGAHVILSLTANSTTIGPTAGVTTAATGSTFVVFIVRDSAATISSVTDSYTNSYTQDNVEVGFTFTIESWICVNGSGGAAHTWQAAQSPTGLGLIAVVEARNVRTVSPVDQNPTPTTSGGTSFSITSGTLAEAVELAIAFVGTGTSGGAEILTWSGGFSGIDAIGDSTLDTGGTAFKVTSSTAAVTASVVSTAGGTSSGSMILLTLLSHLSPTINTQPQNASAQVGDTASFSVSASASAGGGSLSYQWQVNGSNVSGGTGATTANYTTPALVSGNNNDLYTVIVTDSNGSTVSNQARLTVFSEATIAWVGA